MIVNTLKRCRIPQQKGQHLIYVEYLETAPWNHGTNPKFKGVGTVLIAAAIQLSNDDGSDGRIGLHSLPQADSFYRDRCKMTDLGIDKSYSNLRYFEMTKEQSEKFLKGGS